jgi:hypothetical protein
MYNNWSGLRALIYQSLFTYGAVVGEVVDLMRDRVAQGQVVGLLKLVFWSVPAM